MADSHQRASKKVSALTLSARALFVSCVAQCAGSVLSRLMPTQVIPTLLDIMWSAAADERAHVEKLRDCASALEERIPRLDEEADYDVEADTRMRFGVVLLDAVDNLVGGDSERTLGVLVGYMDALLVAMTRKDPAIALDFELLDHIEDPSMVPGLLYEQWRELEDLLGQLRAGDSNTTTLRSEWSERGESVAAELI